VHADPPAGSCHLSCVLRASCVSLSPSVRILRRQPQISFNSPTWYIAIARTTIDGKKKYTTRNRLCVSPTPGLSLSIYAALLAPRRAHECEPEAAGRRPSRVSCSRVASRHLWSSTSTQHSASCQFFEDDDALHPQRRRACHCIRSSRNHALVPIPIHYAPNPYDSNASHACVCMRSEDFFEPHNVPR